MIKIIKGVNEVMGRVKALFDYAKSYKGYKDALKRSQNKEIRGLNTLQNAALLNLVAQYKEQYSARKDYYETLKSVAESYEASEDETLREQAQTMYAKDLPFAMDEMLRYRDMLQNVTQMQKDREEAQYFDIDDIGDDEAMADLDEAEAKLRSKDLSSDEKSFWERKRDEIFAQRESFIGSVNDHRESFDEHYNDCKSSIEGMDASTKSIKDIQKAIKAVDINDPDASAKLAELRAQLNKQQTDFDSHVESYRDTYKTMAREHNEFIDTAGFSPFKKIKDTECSNIKTFAEMQAEQEVETEPEFETESKAPITDRIRASVMERTDGLKERIKNQRLLTSALNKFRGDKTDVLTADMKPEHLKTPEEKAVALDEEVDLGDDYEEEVVAKYEEEVELGDDYEEDIEAEVEEEVNPYAALKQRYDMSEPVTDVEDALEAKSEPEEGPKVKSTREERVAMAESRFGDHSVPVLANEGLSMGG
jgi:hypothetical protein